MQPEKREGSWRRVANHGLKPQILNLFGGHFYPEMKNVQKVVTELLVTSPTNHLAVNTNPYNSKRTGYVQK